VDYSGHLQPDLAALYEAAGADRSLDAEVKLLRAQLAAAVERSDFAAQGWALELLIKATRANTAGGEGGLEEVFDRVASEIAAGGERSTGSGLAGLPKRPGRKKGVVAPASLGRPMSVAETAAYLGVSVRTVSRRIARGELRTVRSGDGRKHLIPVEQLEAAG
jgi:excisionase family DNA binding protein